MKQKRTGNQNQKTKELKKELKSLFKSLDFISDNFLQYDKLDEKEHQIYFNIYQQLGLAWEFLGLQCNHDEGYKKTGYKKEACKICGKIKNTDEYYILLPRKGAKKIGRKLKPNSRKTFKTKKEAQLLNDSISFHGASLNVDVHNSYKSSIRGFDNDINIAAERIVNLTEDKVECNIDEYLISIRLKNKKAKGDKKYGNFPWELKKKQLENFPVLFEFDEDYKFLGLTIFR